MRFRVLIAAVVVFLALPAVAAVTLHRHFTYWLFTGESVTIAWDASAGADRYEYELLNVERGERVFAQGSTAGVQTAVAIPKTGHWVFRVRAVNSEGVSDWARCDDAQYAQIDGKAQSWWVFAWVAPAQGLEIQ